MPLAISAKRCPKRKVGLSAATYVTLFSGFDEIDQTFPISPLKARRQLPPVRNHFPSLDGEIIEKPSTDDRHLQPSVHPCQNVLVVQA